MAPPKVLIFLWKLEHKILPTSRFLATRLNMGQVSSIYKWRGLEDETWDHVFHKYEMVVWS